MNENILCRRIAELRRAQGWTQEQLAARLGISFQAVSKWENAQSCPDIMLLPELADIFRVSIDSLFGRDAGLVPAAEEPAGADAPALPELPWPEDGGFYAVLYHGHELIFGEPVAENDPRRRIEFCWEGPIRDLHSAFDVNCDRVEGSVDAGGSVNCDTVGGDVRARGDVNCGDVLGNVRADGGVDCGSVAGSVYAGGSTNCDDVDGDVCAGGSVDCGKVGGDLKAGGNVDCGDVEGDLAAGGKVDCGKVGGDVASFGGVDCGSVGGDVRSARTRGGEDKKRAMFEADFSDVGDRFSDLGDRFSEFGQKLGEKISRMFEEKFSKYGWPEDGGEDGGEK